MPKSKKIKPASGANRITRLEFCATHFGAAQFPSDMFYVNLANKVHPILQKVFSSQNGFAPGISKRMAIVLTCYIEDLVAGSGIWAAFTSLYRKKYRNQFPFYNIREQSTMFPYDDEMPSFHSVLFLLWYVANDVRPDTMVNPNNPALRMLAMALMPDLQEAYEDAPETPARPMLMPEKEIGILLFYQIRNLCTWLCNDCYLTRIGDKEKIAAGLKDFISRMLDAKEVKEKGALTYAVESFIPMNALIGPLAIPAYEWLAEIVNLYHEPEEECYLSILAEVKSRPYAYYRYVTVGESELVLENVNGEKLTLSAATMPGEKFDSQIVPGKSALLSLVFIDGVWMMNGFGLPALPPEIFADCRDKHLEKEKQRKCTYKYLLNAFGKQLLGVCGSYEEFMMLSNGNNAPKTDGDPKLIADIKEAGNVLYFLNSDSTVSLLPGWAGCVKIKDNPFYDKEKAEQDGISLILDHSLSSPEMRQYLIKNKLIPDAALNSIVSAETGRKLFQKNIRFFNDYADRDTMSYVMEL